MTKSETSISVQLECQLKEGLSTDNGMIIQEAERRLTALVQKKSHLFLKQPFHAFLEDNILCRILESVRVCEASDDNIEAIETACISLIIFNYYQLHSPAVDNDRNSDELAKFYSVCDLPTVTFDGLWESFDGNVNNDLLDYASTLFTIESHEMDTRLFGLNKLLLLHGPPGSGKTSLCKALAQKIAIRSANLSSQAIRVKMLEVDCNSLFSKWFSESGKLMKEMFDEVHRILAEPATFLCIIIDEVESISVSRKALFKGSEPSDSIRAVNVLLTQLDQLRLKSKVLVLATSNLLDTIDPAFIDRVDCMYEIGSPGVPSRYQILAAGIRELMRVRLIEEAFIPAFGAAKQSQETNRLASFAESLQNCSGRYLNKLPILAFANSIRMGKIPVDYEAFLTTLSRIANKN